MRKFVGATVLLNLFLSFLCGSPVANATKIGASCNQINLKSSVGILQLICKKNSQGKLVWTKAEKASSTPNANPTKPNTSNPTPIASVTPTISPSPTLAPTKEPGISIQVPEVLKIVSGDDWIAYQIQNISSSQNLIHPSFMVTSYDSNGKILFQKVNEKFPMLAVGETSWMYMPFSKKIYGSMPTKIVLTPQNRGNNRPYTQSKWPIVSNVHFSDSELHFTLTNMSTNQKLSSDTSFSYFCFDSQGTPIYANQVRTNTLLNPGANSEIKWLTVLKDNQCNLITITLGPVFSN